MTYIGCVDAALAEPGFFKREKAKQLVDQFADDLDSTLAPGPDLRRNQVEDRNAEPLQMARQAQMEIGAIGEQRRHRRIAARITDERRYSRVDARADGPTTSARPTTASFAGIDDRLDAGRLQPRAGATIEIELGKRASEVSQRPRRT